MASCMAASYRQLNISYLELGQSNCIESNIRPVVVIVRKVCQLDVVVVNFVTLPLTGSEGGDGILGDVDQRGGHRQLGQ